MTPNTSSPDTPYAGSELFDARYRIESLAGSGGTADVWLAYDERLHRRVAIKVLKERDANGPWASLESEGRMLARLSHPNIVSVFDAGAVDGRPFLVSEYVAGEPLREAMRAAGSLPLERGRAIGAQVAAALECAHANGVVHGDVKPENVLLDARGNAKLADFGLAAPAETVAGSELAEFAGTIAYIAPEVIHGERPSAASDVYSLGLLLYELLTGHQPYGGPTAAVALARRLSGPPLGERLPAELSATETALVLASLQADPGSRPAAAELHSAFSRPPRENETARWRPAAAAFALPAGRAPADMADRAGGQPVPRRMPASASRGRGILIAAALPVVAVAAIGLAIFAGAGSGDGGGPGDLGSAEDEALVTGATPTPEATLAAKATATPTIPPTASRTAEAATETASPDPTQAAQDRGQPVSESSGPGPRSDNRGDDDDEDKPKKPKSGDRGSGNDDDDGDDGDDD